MEMVLMIVGYARVSSESQNLERQIKALEEYGVEEIFQEKVSGKNINDRDEFKRMLKFLRKGDTLVVPSLDRLGRDYDDIKAVVAKIKEQDIKLNVLDAEFLNVNTGNVLLDKMMFDMLIGLLGYVAQNEREKILSRQKEGVEIAKEKGIYKGGKVKYSLTSDDKQGRLVAESVVEDFKNNVAQYRIAAKYSIDRKTVRNILREAGLK